MKINGRTPGVHRAMHLISRTGGGLLVQLCALPYGCSEKAEETLPDPPAPIEFARERNGTPIRDGEGMILKYRNTQDPAYQRRLRRVRQLRSIYLLLQALRNDHNVQFDAKRTDDADPEVWIEAVEKEIQEAGISDAEVLGMLEVVGQLNQGIEVRVDKATEDFLSRTAADQGGRSPNAADAPSDT